MGSYNVLFLLVTVWVQLAVACSSAAPLFPSVYIFIPIRNKAHSLPYFFGSLERQDYPKDKISLHIVLDNCIDNSQPITEQWLGRIRHMYNDVVYEAKPNKIMDHLLSIKMHAKQRAEELGAVYILYLDADVILINQNTLTYLVSLKLPVVAPMLNTTTSYIDFWEKTNESGHCKSTYQYLAIQDRQLEGVFQVPSVHSAVLVDLNVENASRLIFDLNNMLNAIRNDITIFSLSAKASNVPMYIVNNAFFGFVPIPRDEAASDTLQDEIRRFREVVTSRAALIHDDAVPEPFDYNIMDTSKIGFDEIYVINLLRRPNRAEKMRRALNVHHVAYRHFHASDGQQLNTSYLADLGVTMLEGYRDPYHNRSLKMGEIGCFLSHYFVWEDMVKNNYSRILVLEDDAYFEPTFSEDTESALSEADKFVPNWDLMFLGRKPLNEADEEIVEGASSLVWPSYSYWTVAYALTLTGAQKLLAAKPLEKMVALDEYIPIMYNRNDNRQWLDAFYPRDLIALSTSPLLVYPQLYTGQPGYYTDTENSIILDPNTLV